MQAINLPTFSKPAPATAPKRGMPSLTLHPTRHEGQAGELAKLAQWKAAEGTRPWWMPRKPWRPGER